MAADRNTSNPDDLTNKTRNVLLIRGSSEMDQQLEKLFDPDVWKISYAQDNATALELATAEAFDLIVTSARTTGEESVALLRRLRMARIQGSWKLSQAYVRSFFNVVRAEELISRIQTSMRIPRIH